MRIVDLNARHLDGVLAINTLCTPNVAPLDRQELHRLLDLAAPARAALSGEQVAGYLLAIPDTADYDGEEFGHFLQLGGPFLYVDQVAVDPGVHNQGVGARLYADLIAFAARTGCAKLYCEVNLRPPNPGSLRFHRRLGFVQIGELETTDRRRVALLIHDVQHAKPDAHPGSG